MRQDGEKVVLRCFNFVVEANPLISGLKVSKIKNKGRALGDPAQGHLPISCQDCKELLFQRQVTMYNKEDIKMFDVDRQYILMSALQKAIRWCEVNDARSFAKDLMDMDSKPATVFNRLLIIAAEDVGLADPSLIFYVRKLYDEFENKREQNGIKKGDAFKFPDLREIVDRAVIAA